MKFILFSKLTCNVFYIILTNPRNRDIFVETSDKKLAGNFFKMRTYIWEI